MRSIKFCTVFSRGTARTPISNERGLTLIEIMVVLLIIGGLAATIGTMVSNNLSNSRVKQTRLRFNEVSKALEMYNGDCGNMPTTEQGLAALMADPGKEVCPNWGPAPYLKKKVADDGWDRPMLYESDGNNFVLKSLGKDRKDGGTGEAKDLLSTDEGT